MDFGLTALTLARMQFAFVISAHIIFPAFTIGLASCLAVLNALWLRNRDPVYLTIHDFWKPIFAIVFGMGSCRAWSCRTSSAPTGQCSPTRLAP